MKVEVELMRLIEAVRATPRGRHQFRMRYTEGLTPGQIQTQTGDKIDTIYKRTIRVKKRIEKIVHGK